MYTHFNKSRAFLIMSILLGPGWTDVSGPTRSPEVCFAHVARWRLIGSSRAPREREQTNQ